MPFLAWCGGAWDWFTKSPVAQAIVAVIAFIFAYEAVKAGLENEGAKKQKAKNRIQVTEQKVVIAKTQQEITTERNNDRAEADAAVEQLPDIHGPRELRRDRAGLHAILFGNAEAGGGEGSR